MSVTEFSPQPPQDQAAMPEPNSVAQGCPYDIPSSATSDIVAAELHLESNTQTLTPSGRTAAAVMSRQRAGAAYERCPFNTADYLGVVTREVLDGDSLEIAIAGRVKAELYGPLGRIVRDSVYRVLDQQNDPHLAPFGLYANILGTYPAEQQDVDSWDKLRRCWTATLAHSAREVFDKMHMDHDPSLDVFKTFWDLYHASEALAPSDRVTLLGQIAGGCETASAACTRIAFAMDKFLIENGWSDKNKRAVMIARSTGPILKTAGLGITQQIQFNNAYLGSNSKDATTDFTRIRTDMLAFTRNGRLDFVSPIEDLPLSDGNTVGAVAMVYPRIGCPILLTPRLLQSLWGAYGKSLVAADLI